jgi:NDP-sugar pyrophosphorylase family protein
MPATDLDALPLTLAECARVEPNGEVSWSLSDAPAVIEALADADRLVLGLDIRAYSADGAFKEVAWFDVGDERDVRKARDQAITSLRQGHIPGEWVLVTW